MKQIIFSGIQPSGDLHIGNYLGAISQWAKMVKENPADEYIFCVVDLHAIVIKQNPLQLHKKIREIFSFYVASGIDPRVNPNIHIFVQSENPDHPYLAWIFDCLTSFGQMSRMTQFKDKSQKQGEQTTVGIFNYPALMAADILLYDTTFVPVGEDQIQHLELTRDIAEKYNHEFGERFVLPKVHLQKETARIMSLQNPLSKMSKSEKDPKGTINLLDTPNVATDKIMRAVTDSGNEIVYRDDKPALCNLLSIYSGFSGQTIAEIENQFRGKQYSEFKRLLAQVVSDALLAIQKKYSEIMKAEEAMQTMMRQGADFTKERSQKKLQAIKADMGLG